MYDEAEGRSSCRTSWPGISESGELAGFSVLMREAAAYHAETEEGDADVIKYAEDREGVGDEINGGENPEGGDQEHDEDLRHPGDVGPRIVAIHGGEEGGIEGKGFGAAMVGNFRKAILIHHLFGDPHRGGVDLRIGFIERQGFGDAAEAFIGGQGAAQFLPTG